MATKLLPHELGYALAIIDFIGCDSSVTRKELADRFSVRVLTWLIHNDLIIISNLIIENNLLEARAGLGQRAKALSLIRGEERISVLDSINNMLK